MFFYSYEPMEYIFTLIFKPIMVLNFVVGLKEKRISIESLIHFYHLLGEHYVPSKNIFFKEPLINSK